MKAYLEKTKRVNQKELEYKVKEMYKEVALHPEVEYHFEMGRQLAERLGYPSNTLDAIPRQAIDSFAGVGYFFDFAQLKKGEVVLDLGSGSGMDVFYAALEVGETGEVIGVDMTKEQLEKSALLSKEAGFKHVIFRKSYIEETPIIPNSIDVVISNGVINLSSEKAKVFEEAARVLKTGGRFVISDIVTKIELPENITCNATLWAACIGGAMQVDRYKQLIENAGMKIQKVKENPYAFISDSAQGATDKFGIKSVSILAVKQ